MPDDNPYTSPDDSPGGFSDDPASTDETFSGREVFVALVTVFVAIGTMCALHYAIYQLGYDARVPVFVFFSLLYILWPLIAFIVPRPCLFGVMAFPLFGIWLGLYYTDDMRSYMFEAQPPCFAGIFGVCVTGFIGLRRLSSKTRGKHVPKGG